MHTAHPGAAGEHEFWSDRLSAYLDGELKNHERERLEAHVAACAACAVTLAELREVMARARTLVDTPPATDLWPAIEAQLTPRGATARPERGRVIAGPSWWGQRFELGLPQLAAAAAVLVVLSAGVMWMVLRGGEAPGNGGTLPGSNGTAPGPVAGRIAPPAAPAPGGFVATNTSVDLNNPQYDAAVAELEQALSEGKNKLSPRTLAVVQHNLQIIDNALADARRAVAADPGNAWLRSHLATTMKKKVELLRSATMLASAQG
jgi:hypothetical protein